MQDINEQSVQRLFSAEGALHVYSSLPAILTPAHLYLFKDNQNIKDIISDCNIYIITTRRRVLIDKKDLYLKGSFLFGYFIVPYGTESKRTPFQYHIITNHIGDNVIIHDIKVSPSGGFVDLFTTKGRIPLMAHEILATATSLLTAEDQMLEVLYIGQGIGRSAKRTAVDRLLNHATLQRILAEINTFKPEQEILLLLYRFEHKKIIASNGGNFNVEAKSTVEEDFQHLKSIHNIRFNRHETISLVEATLIRYFQPYFNIQLRKTNFTAQRKIKVLEALLSRGMTGIIVEICSSNIRAKLYSSSVRPMDISKMFTPKQYNGNYLDTEELKHQWKEELQMLSHSHFAQFPLTTPNERETFLHGMVWYGEKERNPFMHF